jgi:hypothetical protein
VMPPTGGMTQNQSASGSGSGGYSYGESEKLGTRIPGAF